MIQTIEEIIEELEAKIEGFLILHPISKFAVDHYLKERITDSFHPECLFVLDLSTSIDLPDEVHQHFKQLIKKYGDAVLEQAMKLYISKHRSQILRNKKSGKT